MIQLENVYKRYGARTVVHDLSFRVQTDEILGFLGPNGAGKTTTIRMIAGATTATAGQVKVAGFDMANQRLAAARHLGYLPERPPLYDALDVTTYLRFVARAKAMAKVRIAAEIDRVMQACRIEHMARREIYKLSKGYRQRVGLAQALLGAPKVLLLDEPTIGLDPGQIQETREVIRNASVGHAVLLSTHILPEVSIMCARVAIIHEGRLLAVDTPAGLERAAEQSTVVRLRVVGDAARVEAALRDVDGVRAVDVGVVNPRAGIKPVGMLEVKCLIDERDGIEAAIARCLSGPFDLFALERQRPTLENVFLHYVRRNNPLQLAS